MHYAFDISVIVFAIVSIPTATEKTGVLFTSGKVGKTLRQKILTFHKPSSRAALGIIGSRS